MSKNIKINGTTYNGVPSVAIPLADNSGETIFRDASEVIDTPTATKTITANGSNIDVTDCAKVTVNVPTASELSLHGITMSPTSVTVAADATVDTVKAAITSATASYTASGYTGTLTRAITVSELTVNGSVPANGTTGDMVVSWGGKSTPLSVTVQAKTTTVSVTGVALDKTSGTLTVGNTVSLTATIAPFDATNKAVTWASSAPTIAEVTGSGLTATVTAKMVGSTNITVTTTDGNKVATYALTVEASSAAGDTTAYAWATIPAYYSSMYLPKTAGEYLTLKKTEASSAEEYGAAVDSDIDLSDISKTVTVTIDGTLYDANGAVSTEDAGGLLNAQLTRTNGTWAMNWLEFQEGGPRHTTFSATNPANVEISGSAIRIYAGKRVWNSNEYDIKFSTNKANYRVDYMITVAVS